MNANEVEEELTLAKYCFMTNKLFLRNKNFLFLLIPLNNKAEKREIKHKGRNTTNDKNDIRCLDKR